MSASLRRAARSQKKAKPRKPETPPAVFGPSWSEMTDRQRELYPCLSQEELASLWNDERSEEARG
jgi:hypothetical protein